MLTRDIKEFFQYPPRRGSLIARMGFMSEEVECEVGIGLVEGIRPWENVEFFNSYITILSIRRKWWSTPLPGGSFLCSKNHSKVGNYLTYSLQHLPWGHPHLHLTKQLPLIGSNTISWRPSEEKTLKAKRVRRILSIERSVKGAD